jgi:hypothetical protein
VNEMMEEEKFTEEYKGYKISAISYGFADWSPLVVSPEGRLIYEAPFSFLHPVNAVKHGLRWLKSTWLKEDEDDPPGDGGEG